MVVTEIIDVRNKQTEQDEGRYFLVSVKPSPNENNLTLNESNHLCNTFRQSLLHDNVKGSIQITLITTETTFPCHRIPINNQEIKIEDIYAEYYEYSNSQMNVFNNKNLRAIREIRLSVIRTNPNTQGRGTNKGDNFCLARAIERMGHSVYPASRIHDRLKLSYDEGISPLYLDRVEEILGIGLSVTFAKGEWISDYHPPSNQYNFVAYIKYNGGHYLPDFNAMNETIQKSQQKLRKYKDPLQLCIKYRVHGQETLYFYRQDNQIVSHVVKPKHCLTFDNKKDVEPLINQMETPSGEDMFKFMEGQIDALKAINPKYDPYTYGGFGDHIKYHIYKSLNQYLATHKNYQPIEPISSVEADIIQKATKAPFNYHTKGEHENVYEYDQNSCFPYYLQHNRFHVPYRQPIYKSLDETQFNTIVGHQLATYGLYRVDIDAPSGVTRGFIYNDNGWYTHWDLAVAKNMGFAMKIHPCDEYQFNCLQYPSNYKDQDGKFIRNDSRTIGGLPLFREYFEERYQLKQAHPEIKILKGYISRVHGYLSAKRKQVKIVKRNEEGYFDLDNDPEKHIITDFSYIGNETLEVKLQDTCRTFYSELARLAPFLYSFIRYEYYFNWLKKYKDHIIKVQRDAIYTTIPIDPQDMAIGTELGQFKQIFYNKYTVYNQNRYTKTLADGTKKSNFKS